jgi:DNA replication and repair protein RecF
VQLKTLRLINFKNYQDETVVFQNAFTAILGKNGAGKTNILEAIHYLSLTRGYSNSADAQNVRREQSFFTVIGKVEGTAQIQEIQCSFDESGKSLKLDGKECRRYSDHLGKFPVVQIAPQDISLVWEIGEVRRRFFDLWMSQINRSFLDDLIRYQHFLKQRNTLLKDIRDGAPADAELLGLYEREMTGPAERITRARRAFLAEIAPFLTNYYQGLAGESEKIDLQVESEFNPDQGNPWTKLREKDISAGRTTLGPHRDEFHFHLNGMEVRKYGSQGQQKSFLIALKLASYSVISTRSGIKPVLLLDDIFDKMDDLRLLNLLTMTGSGDFGQVILTDSSPVRASQKLSEAGITFGVILIEEGKIKG